MESPQIKVKHNLVKIIFALALPTMLEQLMQTAVQYIDTAMVGSLGTDATAAVGATVSLNWLINGTVSALGVGFLAYVSQALGRGDKEAAKKASAQSVGIVVAVGVALTVVTLLLSPVVPVLMRVPTEIRSICAKYFFILYAPMLFRTATAVFGTVLRASGDSKTPMYVSILVNVVNVVLNFLFIYPTRKIWGITVFGAGLGVIGAALASAIAFAVGGVLITFKLYSHRDISPKGYAVKPDKEVLLPCLKVAIPNMLQRFATSLGYVVFASMINSLGAVSAAAHTVANTVESAFYIPAYGMQTAAATLAGNAYGEKNSKKINELYKTVNVIEVLIMSVSGGLLFAFAPAMTAIFSKAPDIISLGSTVLRMVALTEPFFAISIVAEGMLLGMGDTKRPFIFNVIGMWGVRIVGTFICTQIFSFGLVSAWTCMIAHNLLLCMLFVISFKQNLKKGFI